MKKEYGLEDPELKCDYIKNDIQFEIVDLFEHGLVSPNKIQTVNINVTNDTSLFVLYHTNTLEMLENEMIVSASEQDAKLTNQIHQIIPDKVDNPVKYVLVKVTPDGWKKSQYKMTYEIPVLGPVTIRWVWEGGPSTKTVHELEKRVPCSKFNIAKVYDVALKDPGNDPNSEKKKEPICQNGGSPSNEYWYCNCMPGFAGDECEIRCGPNAFGKHCTNRCSSDDKSSRGCEGKLLCNVDSSVDTSSTYSPNCHCASGYKGEACNETCDAGTYGSECDQQCPKCVDRCDPVTGYCICDPLCPHDRCDNGTGLCNCDVTCPNSCNNRTGACPPLIPTNIPEPDAPDDGPIPKSDTNDDLGSKVVTTIKKLLEVKSTVLGVQISGVVWGSTAVVVLVFWAILNVYIFCFRKKKKNMNMDEDVKEDDQEEWLEDHYGGVEGGEFQQQDIP
ncbi:hypothetical protein WDU94_002067 [Cyamophila willieti]